MRPLTVLVLGTLLATSAAFAATAPEHTDSAKGSGTYYWLHPKLGMVKVDRATNAMVTGRRATSGERQKARAASPG